MHRIAVAARIAALVALCAFAGCGKNESGSGSSAPTGPAVGSTGAASTASVAQEIEQKITADKEMAGAQVKVTEQNGTIMLEGAVKSQAQKDQAEKIVTDVQKAKNLQPGVMDSLLIKDGK